MTSEHKSAIESFGLRKIKSEVTLDFMPAYSALHFGVVYGREYHEDPLFRIEQDRHRQRQLFERFGRFGLGCSDPEPVIGVGIQPLDFLNHVLGGRFEFRPNESVWTPDKPLSHIETVDDVRGLGDVDWETHPDFAELFRQVAVLKEHFPDLPVSSIQGVHRDGARGDRSLLTMHTPCTTAFRLLGERILELMMLEEDVARAVFSYIMRQYRNLWDAICCRTGWQGRKIHFGDCAATMMSPQLFERFCLPMYMDLMKEFDAGLIHSCGPSSGLLELFARVPKISQLQLGYGTDLGEARALFPQASILAYYSPAVFLSADPGWIRDDLRRMANELEHDFLIAGADTDPDTPTSNLHAYLETAREINEAVAG